MLVPEDRKRSGVILDLGADRNVGLPSLGALSKLGFVDRSRERELASGVVSDLAVRISDVTAPVSSLSGGNQQKIALGKWLVKQPKLLILDEPLRGIDVNAKSEIHRMLRRLADDGLAIILISSELPEVLGLSDRVLVMRDGKLAATFDQKVLHARASKFCQRVRPTADRESRDMFRQARGRRRIADQHAGGRSLPREHPQAGLKRFRAQHHPPSW